MDAITSKSISWEELNSATLPSIAPFQLDLGNQQLFFAEQIIRMTPRRRMIVFGTWQDKPVVAKLFFNARRGKSLMEKDVRGINALLKNHILTPTLYYSGQCRDERIHIAMIERLFNIKTLDELWRAKSHVEEILPILKLVIAEFVKLHTSGLQQHDCNLKNYLICDKHIYLIDGEFIEASHQAVPLDKSIKNLALFFSKLGLEIESHIKALFDYYLQLRGMPVSPQDLSQLHLAINAWNHKNWQRKKRKIYEDCAEFTRIRGQSRGVYDRNYITPALKEMLDNPELAFHHETTRLQKIHQAYLVATVTLDNKQYLIKRYQPRWLLLRPSKAALIWRLAHKLYYFSIPVPKPIAYIEKRQVGFKSNSYYISEYFPYDTDETFFNRHPAMFTRMTNLQKNIAKLGITFRNLKKNDVLVDLANKLFMFELELAKEYTWITRMRDKARKMIGHLFNRRDRAEQIW